MAAEAVRGKVSVARDYRDVIAHWSWKSIARSYFRDAAVYLLSLPRRIDRTSEWIRFPYYHHVFDDERRGFARQLTYLRNYGEFLTLDQAVSLLESGDAIDGRYFSVTFDDGFRSGFVNALPILAERGVSAAFFVPSKFIGMSVEKDREATQRFFAVWGSPVPVEFLSWDDCRCLVGAGMIVGSHTCSHVSPIDLDSAEIVRELRESKAIIERELSRPCEHFCCPNGVPEVHFVVERDPGIAKALGYRSFLTTRRGPMRRGDSAYLIRRDHLLARWDNYQLRYFLSL